MDLGFTAVPAIVALVYVVCEVFKAFATITKNQEKEENVKKLLPVISAISGLILGLLVFYVSPDLISATDPFTAAAIGIASGLGATGINQVFKQLSK